jgi:site-specific DNA recombinase
MEQSRLGRSLDEVPYALKRITDAGVRVWCYLTDTEVKRERAADKFMVHAIAFVDDMHREQSRERTRDALRRKAERGHVVGGMVYGYRNVRAEGRVERVIEAAEAEVVRRIYQETGRGLGYLRIARRLNADGIVGPRGLPWAASTIRAILFRDLYRGRPVWGRTRWADVGGTKRKVRVSDPSAWVTVADPRLQIIDDALWAVIHQRLAQGRAVYLGRTNGKHGGRPTNPTESKYLLTGLRGLRCGHCGGGLHVSRQSGRGGQGLWLYYVCARQRTRGIQCPGGLRVVMARVDEAMLDVVGDRLLTPQTVTAAIRQAVARLAPHADDQQRRDALQRDLRGVHRELTRYAEAVAHGGTIPALVTAMQERDRRREALEAELEQLDAYRRTATLIDEAALSAELRALCQEWRGLLLEDPPIAQQLLRQLLTERLTVMRTPEGIRITGRATFGPLVASVMREGVVPPG